MKKIIVLLIFLCICLSTAVLGFWIYKCRYQEPQWITKKVTSGEIKRVVTATGILSAINVIDVGCEISGRIASISADFNDRVFAGQPIAKIDTSAYEAQLLQAQANNEAAVSAARNTEAKSISIEGQAISLNAEIEVAQANIRKSEIALESSKRSLKRIEGMYSRKMISESEWDDAKSTVKSAEAQLDAAKAQLKVTQSRKSTLESDSKSLRAQIDSSQAQVRQTQALLDAAKLNIKNSTIISPIDGVILARKISVGQTVAASFQTPTLFTIAQDLYKMQIEALVDESDICLVKEGQTASFTVDAYPDRDFSGLVKQVRLTPSIQNTVMFTVIVSVDNADLSLRPGMSSCVDILVEQKTNALKVPTQSLFFTPPIDIISRYSLSEREATDSALIWIIGSDSKILPVDIKTGITNALFTEIISGPVASGATVVVDDYQWWKVLLGSGR